jgi:uncharacterized protein (DUF433 family)
MQLEDYFVFEKVETEFGSSESIRVKGHNIRIESVLDHYKQGMGPEQIARDVYPTLTLEEVYAVILYYLRHTSQVETYMAEGKRICDAYYQKYLERGPFWPKEEAERKRATAANE